jgi:hypothetical protein
MTSWIIFVCFFWIQFVSLDFNEHWIICVEWISNSLIKKICKQLQSINDAMQKNVCKLPYPKGPMLTFSPKKGNQIVQRPTKKTKMIVSHFNCNTNNTTCNLIT